eukprot:3294975-Prymnesium_polylepis.1
MPFSPRTARGCNPRCVHPRQRPRGLDRPCLSGWLKTEYAGHGLSTGLVPDGTMPGTHSACAAPHAWGLSR